MKTAFTFLATIIIVILISDCARPGAPTGGDKDTIPPVAIKTKPENYSGNYDRKKVIIAFDEFISLENAFSEFTISPPLEEQIVPVVKGKRIEVDFPSGSLDSATYSLDFGQSIKDYTEGNIYSNYQFVVSLMPFVDSFSVSGTVVDAFTLKPVEGNIFVFLYKILADTAPYTTIPAYLGRTNPTGEFSINHISPGTYAVFALIDGNMNLMYDLPTEVIAFLDEPIVLHPDSFPVAPEFIDTSQLAINNRIDSIYETDTSFVNEELKNDSTINAEDAMKHYGYSFNMYSFTEEEPFKQYMVDYSRTANEKIQFIFNEKSDSLPIVDLLHPDTTGKWYFLEENPTYDTLVYWLADSNLVMNDSIVIKIQYPFSDTTGELITQTDTLLFRLKKREKEEKGTRRKGGLGFLQKGEKEKMADTLAKPVPRVSLVNNIKKSGHDLNVPVVFESSAPVKSYNNSLIQLVRIEDTLEVPDDFRFIELENNPRKFKLEIEYEADFNYKLKLFEGALIDMYDRTIDTTIISFITQKDDYYGIVNVLMKNVNTTTIVQLLDKKEKLVKSKIIDKDQMVSFEYIYPGSYILKVIIDRNNNGVWDTGNYKAKLQPEKVLYLEDEIEVRSNWEVEYEWEIK